MFSDELAKIVASEDDADNMIKQAKQEEKKILEEAKEQSRKIIEAAEHEGKNFFAKQVEEGKAISQGEYDKFMEETKNANEAMMNKAEERLDHAVSFIAERLVKSSVNS